MQVDYIPLHWGAQNGMDDSVKFHLSETDVNIEGWVGFWELHVHSMTACDTCFAQNVVLQAVVQRCCNTKSDVMQPSYV